MSIKKLLDEKLHIFLNYFNLNRQKCAANRQNAPDIVADDDEFKNFAKTIREPETNF